MLPAAAERRLLSAAECAVSARLTGTAAPLDEAAAAAARAHRVHVLIASTLTPAERAQQWAAGLTRDLRAAAAFADRHEASLRSVVTVLAGAGVEALLLKGSALAYLLYPEPYLRPRTDTDVLVAAQDVARAERALLERGWSRDPDPGHELASAQRHYTRVDGRLVERIDLHWRVVNQLTLADALTWDELRHRSIPVSRLNDHARAPSLPDALALACLHLHAHHADESAVLLWLYDIHLLTSALDDHGKHALVEVASRPAMAAACRNALTLTDAAFGTAAASVLVAALPSAPDIAGRPPSLSSQALADLAALPSWRARLRLLREHLFPSAAYLRSRYPSWPAPLLPLAALCRIAAGAPKWLRRPR